MNSKIMQASIYPAILTMVALMVVVGLLIFVVPKIVSVFETSQQALPLLTRIMLLLLSANREGGTAYLLISHNRMLLSSTCHRILYLEEGRIAREREV